VREGEGVCKAAPEPAGGNPSIGSAWVASAVPDARGQPPPPPQPTQWQEVQQRKTRCSRGRLGPRRPLTNRQNWPNVTSVATTETEVAVLVSGNKEALDLGNLHGKVDDPSNA
jgi:hypothetical protein